MTAWYIFSACVVCIGLFEMGRAVGEMNTIKKYKRKKK
jgi:hypothetical protein